MVALSPLDPGTDVPARRSLEETSSHTSPHMLEVVLLKRIMLRRRLGASMEGITGVMDSSLVVGALSRRIRCRRRISKGMRIMVADISNRSSSTREAMVVVGGMISSSNSRHLGAKDDSGVLVVETVPGEGLDDIQRSAFLDWWKRWLVRI